MGVVPDKPETTKAAYSVGMFRGLGRSLARFVGMAFAVLGIWVLAVNVIYGDYPGSVRVFVLGSAFLGTVGGILYILSFDGPDRFRVRWVRLAGWLGMLVLALLPWSFWFVMFAMVLATIPTLLFKPTVAAPPEDPTDAG